VFLFIHLQILPNSLLFLYRTLGYNDITDENGRVSQDYLIEKLKNKINFFGEFSRLKRAIPKEWYVQLSEEKSVKTTIKFLSNPQIFWFLISLKLVGVFVYPPPNSTQQFIISL
jgi:hypothetical protein